MKSSPEMERSDLRWLALLLACWVAELAITWERWGNPLVDCGREMNLPLRLARGEILYSQVSYLYGPFSPYLNAGLYKIFGASLGVLYADGILTATLILVLVYCLSRIWMKPVPASAATLLVMGMCALKPSGNYILPYSYSALHGCAAGLCTLLLILRYVQTRKQGFLVAAGVLAAVAVLAKTEFGAGALLAGVCAAVLTELPDRRKAMQDLLAFLVPALGISGAVYAFFVSLVGWRVMNHDNHVFFANVPAPLAYFNLRLLGADRAGRNLFLMLGVALQLFSLAALLAWVSEGIAGRREAGHAPPSEADRAAVAWPRLAVGIACGLAGTGIAWLCREWQSGPFVAAPLYLTVGILALLWQYARRLSERRTGDTQSLSLLVTAIFSLAMLARLLLRVRSGGSYGSYLLPATVVLFAYAWVERVPLWLTGPRGRPLARNVALTVLALGAVMTMITVTYRYRAKLDYRLATERGVMTVDPDYGVVFEQAIAFIDHRTMPGNTVAVIPEGTSLDFFTDRRNPLREEIITPGFLDSAGEDRTIEELAATKTKLVLIPNRPTPEFGAPVFGRDYDGKLMSWIEMHYADCDVLGRDTRPPLSIGDKRFFIRVYCRK